MVSSAMPSCVELVEHPADVLVVRDHHVVVVPLPALALVFLRAMRAEVHRRRVPPHEERLALLVALVDELERVFGRLVVHRFHALLRQGAGVLDLLAALAVGPGVQHAARAEALLELGVLRVIRVFGLFLGIEVIEVAEELVEAVHRGQELVLVPEVVLAELTGRVAQRLEQLGDRRVLLLQAHVGAGHADLGQPRPDRVLAGDERRTTCRAALLRVVVGERHALVAHAVDVRRPVAHLAPAVVADVPPAHVVAPEDQDVRFLCSHA